MAKSSSKQKKRPSRGRAKTRSERRVTGNAEVEPEPGPPRFKPPQERGVVPPAFEPGLVEVELVEEARPELVATASGEPREVRSPTGVDLSPMNRILRRHNLKRAEPSFQTPPQEAARVQTAARQRGR